MKKIILSLVFIITAITAAFAQNDLMARLEYEEALKALEAKDYKLSVKHADKVVELVGWNAKIGFIKIQALEQLADFSNFENPLTFELNDEVAKYLNYAKKQNPDDVVMDKFKLVYEIDKKLSVVRDEKKLLEEYGKKYIDFKNNFELYATMPEFAEAEKAGTAKDYAKAVSIYKSMDKKQNPLAFSAIAQIAYNGKDGYSKNVDEAVTYFLKALNLGNLSQARSLALIYRFEDKYKNRTEALKWLKIGAKNGITDCYYSLGTLYGHIEPQKAIFWLNKGLESDESTTAMRFIGDIYEKGEGMPNSDVEAFKWYLKAASWTKTYSDGTISYGDKKAMVKVATAYKYGTGVEKNEAEHFKWVLKAAELEVKEMYFYVGELYQYGFGVEKNTEKALKWYNKGAENEDAKCMNILAKMYNEGIWVKKDKKLAKEWQIKYEAAQAKK